MIITLVSGLNTQPAEFTDMKSCMDYAPKVEAQATVKDVTCLPFTPEKETTAKFEGMFNMFLNLIQQMEELKLENRDRDIMEPDYDEYSKCRKESWLHSNGFCDSEYDKSGQLRNP